MLVNNAGIHLPYFTNKEIDRSIVNKQLDINTTSVVILTQVFLPLLKLAANTSTGAKIINISSGLASMSNEVAAKGSDSLGLLAYRLSKVNFSSESK